MTKYNHSSPIGQIAKTVTHESQSAGGSSAGKAIVEGSVQECQKMANWLGGRKPSEVDQVAESRALQHGVSLKVKFDHRFPTGQNGERLPSYRIATGCLVDGSEQARQSAAADLRKLLVPAQRRDIEMWLSELSVISAARQSDEFESALRLEAYASRLERYPADVARYALLDRKWKFWPTWEEVSTICDSMSGARRQMVKALETSLKPVPEKEARTSESRARIDGLVKNAFPDPVAQTASDEAKKPHWSETAAPDDKRFAMLKASRAKSALIGGKA